MASPKNAPVRPIDQVTAESAVTELGLARRRIAELEGDKRLQRNPMRRVTSAVGAVFVLTAAVTALVGLAAAAHRLLLWGWP